MNGRILEQIFRCFHVFVSVAMSMFVVNRIERNWQWKRWATWTYIKTEMCPIHVEKSNLSSIYVALMRVYFVSFVLFANYFLRCFATIGIHHILFTFASSDRREHHTSIQWWTRGKHANLEIDSPSLQLQFQQSRLNMHCHQIDWWLSMFWSFPTKPSEIE